MRRRTALAVGLCLSFLPTMAQAQRAVFVVRHAEKASESNDPPVPLSPAGTERARRLASMLKGAGIAAIYSTDYVRTQATAAPLAEALRIPVQIYAAKDSGGKPTAAPLQEKLARHPNDVVLVVGHGNTVPAVLKALGVEEKVEIGNGEYDNLFLVIPKAAGGSLLLRLHF